VTDVLWIFGLILAIITIVVFFVAALQRLRNRQVGQTR